MSKIRILLDEHCSNLKFLLIDLGWSVVTVKDVISREAGKNSVADDQILEYAINNKTVIITKDKNLKIRCRMKSVPFVDLGSPETEARIIDNRLREVSAWKDYL